MLLVFCTTGYSQGILKGQVKSRENGELLEEATVRLKSASLHTHTLGDGSFGIPVTRYPDTLVVSHVGYETMETAVTDRTGHLIIFLYQAPVTLSQVNVTDSRRAIRQITQIDLKANPVNSAQDLLRKVPGLFIAQHAGGGKAEQIFLRGFDIDHGTDVRITTDGMPVNMVSHAHGQGYADLHFLIPETIKDIDFGKGSYYVDQGDFATAGYVNLSTFDRPDKNLVKVEAGQFNTFRTVALLKVLDQQKDDQNHQAYVAGEYYGTNGPFESPQHFNRLNLFAKYTGQLDRRSSLGIQFSTFTSKWNASGQIPERAVASGEIPRWGSIDPTEGGNTGRTNLALKYRYRIADHENWTSTFYFSNYDFSLYSNFTFFLHDSVHGDQIHQSEKRKIYGMDHRYSKQLFGDNSDLTLVAGLGLRYDAIRGISLQHTAQRDSLFEYFALGDIDETNINGYAGLEWQRGKWRISPGIRVDHFIFNYNDQLTPGYQTQAADKTAFSPKLNIVHSVNSQLQAYFKSGMGFHSNDTRVVVAQKGVDILPATYGADLGVIFKPWPKFLIQPALWFIQMQQEFVYVGDEAVVEPSGRTRRMGADLGIRFEPVPWMYIDADISYAYARAMDEAKGENYIPLAPDLTSTGGIAFRPLKGLSANWRYRYMKDRPANEDNSVVAQGYFVNDLVVSYSRNRWEIGCQVENLFDVNWREAQFDTQTRLKNEPAPVSEICYTPGTPFFARLKCSIFF
ncbi:TonB-dependent receptor [Flavihumibacter petaseus]|nr:TonB-dependent receptor [Flavihumibacter petaseus]